MPAHRLAALLAATALLLSACGDDEDDEAPAGASSDSSAPAELVLQITESGTQGSEIEAPGSIEGGPVEISFENTGKEPHDAQLIRVDGDQTAEQVAAALQANGEDGKPIPEWLHGAGGLGTVAPGETGVATELLEPGRHYFFDLEPDRNGGTAELEVTGEDGGELPDTQATIATDEYGFETSGLTNGRNRVTFENVGEEPHHVIAAPIVGKASLADVTKFFMTEGEPSGPPPLDFDQAAGTAVLDGGSSQITELELKSGRYAFVCFITDRAGGPPHVAKGMLQEVKVDGG